MNKIEQAYLNGFFKRAASYGVDEEKAIELLSKMAGPAPVKSQPKVMTAPKAPVVQPKPSVADMNDRAASKGNYVPKPLPNPKTIPLEY
jgi:hypothetical protein